MGKNKDILPTKAVQACRKLNTKEFCFICIKVTKFKNKISKKQKIKNVLSGSSIRQPISLSCLLRHLKIKVNDVPSPSLESKEVNEEVKGNLCNDCEKVVKKFSILSQQLGNLQRDNYLDSSTLKLKKVQMEMDYYLEQVHLRILNGLKNRKFTQNYLNGMSSDPESLSQLGWIDQLRNEIGDKCSRLAVVNPRVYLTPTEVVKVITIKQEAVETEDFDDTATDHFDNQNSDGCSPTPEDSPEQSDIELKPKVRSTDGEPAKKRRMRVVIPDHITLLGGDPLMYQCSICNKKFKTKAHLSYHEFCNGKDKPFKCKTCGKGFIAKSHYEYHLLTHTGKRPYVCPKCGKGFNQKGKVKRHMLSHTGERNFICRECNKGFVHSQGLRIHKLTHTGERPFACTHCNKRFTGMTNLKKHVIIHTRERPFSCPHCGKSFGLKWNLDLHLKTHSGERPYPCDQCSRAFSISKDLRRHMLIHTGERPFKCSVCGTAFPRKDNLARHIQMAHKQSKDVAKQLANEAAAEYLKAK